MFLLLGFVLARALVPGGRSVCRHDVWRLLLGIGLGVGVTSCLFVVALAIGVPPLALEIVALEIVALVIFAGFAWRGGPGRLCAAPAGAQRPRSWGVTLLGLALLIVLASAVDVFVRRTSAAPHGHWDAWAIHNLHARFLYRAQDWRDLFTPILTWSHPDYPLLVPGFVARWWVTLGAEELAVPAATAFLFTFGTVGLLISSLALLRDRSQGILAGLVVLAVPEFLSTGAWQFVDVPMSWFVLAGVVLLALEYPVAAGVAAGLGAWTKNEGLLLFLTVLIGWTLVRQWNLRQALRFGAGALPPLARFKLTLAPPNPLVSIANARQVLLDGTRYVEIASGGGPRR